MDFLQAELRELHHHWTGLVVACLPFLGRSLTQTVTSVAGQIWRNLETLAGMCRAAEDTNTSQTVPSDYVLTQLESLSQLLSYCLLDSSASSGGVAATPPLPSSTLAGAQQQQVPSVVANLFHVFGSSADLPGGGRWGRSASQEQLLQVIIRPKAYIKRKKGKEKERLKGKERERQKEKERLKRMEKEQLKGKDRERLKGKES